MKRNKRYRKVKSANKAVKKALKIERARHSVNMACVIAGFTAQLSIITAAKMKKAGCPKEDVFNKIQEGVEIIDAHNVKVHGNIGNKINIDELKKS